MSRLSAMTNGAGRVRLPAVTRTLQPFSKYQYSLMYF